MHRSLPLSIGAVVLSLLAPPLASAAPYNCDASALRVTLADSVAVEPLTANRNAPECVATDAGGALPATPLPLTGGTLFARTTFTAGDSLSQVAGASAGLSDVSVATPPTILPPLDFSALPGGGVLNTPIGTVDLRPALNALAVPAGPLLRASAVSAEVSGRCRAGSPSLVGESQVGSLSVLGVKLSTTEPSERTLQVLDSQAIDPSDIDIGKVLAPTADLSLLQATLKPILDTLPNVEAPATAVQVRITPGAQIRAGDRLTRRALTVSLAAGGRPLLDAVIGEASVSATGVSCGSIAAAALGLGCTTRRLVLYDVLEQGGRVRLRGAADPRRFAGRTVRIISRWNGKTAARLKVAKSGLFTTTLPLPPESVRHTNRARYQAFIGTERSLGLKLERRMIMTRARSAGARKVRLSGRVVLPLGSPVRQIIVTRRVSCGTVRVVGRFKPAADGRFQVTLQGPPADRVYTFRFRTRVRYNPAISRLMSTYTLPQYVVGA